MYKKEFLKGEWPPAAQVGGLEKPANAEKEDKAFWTLVESLAYLRFALGALMGGGFERSGEGVFFSVWNMTYGCLVLSVMISVSKITIAKEYCHES